MNKLLVKQFIDERHRTIIIALDISSSCLYGSDEYLKHDILCRIAAIITYAGQFGKDEVGLILFSDTVELYLPPLKGMMHTNTLLEKIFSASQKNSKTNINGVLDYIAGLRKKNAMVLLISDFIDDTFEKKLSIVGRLCDLIAIRMVDEFEQNFPSVGFITVKDSETGLEQVIDARDNKTLNEFLKTRLDDQKKMFNRNRVDVLDITTHTVLIDRLIHFFRLRK
jgi:uncharacterized protein (DUF58 family)